MEQNLVSDEELIKRINDVLNDSKEGKINGEKLEESSAEKFHDVSESIELRGEERSKLTGYKDLELENHILASQLEAERRKTKALQSKFQLYENSIKYLESLNGQFEMIKQTVGERGSEVLNDQGDWGRNADGMQKLRQKTVHTAANGIGGGQEGADDGAAISSEPHSEGGKDVKTGYKSRKHDDPQNKDEIAFRDADDFKELEQDLEIIKDKEGGNDTDAEKVYLTKTEKKCLEDIGNLASRMRTPLDEKHQKFFEKDRKRFANRIAMPETQEVDRAETVPPDLAAKGKETPVNLTSTELDGLRSYLLQLKELIARRETAWARTTERDYNQRVEITRFKNEVIHLRMLCEKRQKDIKERDQIIVAKEEEVKELQKRIQGLKSTILKLERKEERMDTSNALTADILENSQLVQKSFGVMKRASLANKGLVPGTKNGIPSSDKESVGKRSKQAQDKFAARKIKSTSSNSGDEEGKSHGVKTKAKSPTEKPTKWKHRDRQRKNSIERVDEKLQRIEEMLHSDVLRANKKAPSKQGTKKLANKNSKNDDLSYNKFSPSNSRMRQEMLGAMTGLNTNQNLTSKTASLFNPKKQQGNAAILANALLAARNTNIFSF